MRRVLVGIVVLEACALVGLLVLHLAGGLERWRRDPPPVPVFRPPVYNAVIGDLVRYERLDRRTGEVLGYLDYEVLDAREYEGSALGREFVLKIVKTDKGGGSANRLIRVQPSIATHGFLPPRFEEDDAYPPGARPVVKSIRAATVPFRTAKRPGFLIEAVHPRDSVVEVKERFWMIPEVALFGVARWERGDEVLVVHVSEKHGS